MRKIVSFITLFVAFAIVFASCADSKYKKTIENLKAAITGESNASATYKAFSAKAAQDGFPNIAKMFAAASAAEAIHVKSHNEVLTKLGEKEFTPVIETPKVAGMEANLQKAIEGETYEYTVMYPGFITAAKAENCDDAVNSFSLASDAEAIHAKLYTKSLNILKETNSDKTVASVWYICPKCGALFDTIEGVARCPLCGVRSASFQKF